MESDSDQSISDQETKIENLLIFTLRDYKDDKINVEKLFLGVNGLPSIYLSCVLDNKIKNGEIKKITEINFDKKKQKSLATVYLCQKNKNLIIIFNQEIKSFLDFSFTRFLFENLISSVSEIIVLDSLNQANLVVKKENNNDFLRVLTTNNHKKYNEINKLGQFLEEGNFLFGLSADILIYCEGKIDASIWIVIRQEYEYNSLETRYFERLNKLYNELDGEIDPKFLKEQIKNGNKSSYNNNIYL